MNNSTVTIEKTIHAAIDRVWQAITDKNKMKEWYFNLAGFDPVIGLEFEFYSGNKENFQYLHKCKITEVIPLKKITYSWRYDGYEGISFVTFELSEVPGDPGETKIKLTHKGLDTFPESNPDFAAQNFEEGWEQIIGKSLKEYLEK